jgi:hypothetical protein
MNLISSRNVTALLYASLSYSMTQKFCGRLRKLIFIVQVLTVDFHLFSYGGFRWKSLLRTEKAILSYRGWHCFFGSKELRRRRCIWVFSLLLSESRNNYLWKLTRHSMIDVPNQVAVGRQIANITSICLYDWRCWYEYSGCLLSVVFHTVNIYDFICLQMRMEQRLAFWW